MAPVTHSQEKVKTVAPTEEKTIARLEVRVDHLENNHKEIKDALEKILVEQRRTASKTVRRLQRAINEHKADCQREMAALAPKKPQTGDSEGITLSPVFLKQILVGLALLGSLLGGGLHYGMSVGGKAEERPILRINGEPVSGQPKGVNNGLPTP